MKQFCLAALGALLLAAPAAARAQLAPAPPPVAIDVHAGALTSAGSWKNTADGRYDYGITVRYSFAPFFAVYGGYDGRQFRLKPTVSDTGKVVDSGIRAGVELRVPPIPGVPLQPFAEVGGLLNTAKYEFTRGTVTDIVTSNFGAGYEIGGGVALRVQRHVSIVPEVRYSTYKPSFSNTDQFQVQAERISAMSYDLGIRFRP